MLEGVSLTAVDDPWPGTSHTPQHTNIIQMCTHTNTNAHIKEHGLIHLTPHRNTCEHMCTHPCTNTCCSVSVHTQYAHTLGHTQHVGASCYHQQGHPAHDQQVGSRGWTRAGRVPPHCPMSPLSPKLGLGHTAVLGLYLHRLMFLFCSNPRVQLSTAATFQGTHQRSPVV
jgi:hypothetical protein